MIIESYVVQASSQHSYQKVQSSVSKTGLIAESELSQLLGEESIGDKATLVNISEAAKKKAQEAKEQAAGKQGGQKQDDAEDKKGSPGSAKNPEQEIGQQLKTWLEASKGAKSLEFSKSAPRNPQELKLQLLEAMIYALTGKRVGAKLWQPASVGSGMEALSRFSGGQLLGQAQGQRLEAMREVTQTEHFFYESESVSYQAQGLIQTADGRSISVDINMQMSREFVSYSSTAMIWEKPKDPLVINYAGTAASLTEQKYSFDLTMDGKMEEMSFVGQGSGFLALDKDGDGQINDGRELFGPQSGDGFEELRAYDSDNNGWIDEADEVFDQLRVWSKDEEGHDQLFTLKELGIGAIYLGNVDTQFSMNDEENNTHGYMRTTSFFLREDGSGGTVSQIDLVV